MDTMRMRRLMVGIFLFFSITLMNSQELELVNKWVEREVFGDFWVSTDRFVLIRNQLLYFTGTDWESRRYRIINYRTGAVQYEFFKLPQFWPFYDQYGKYVFLERDKRLVLFDALTKRELQDGEPVKRNINLYYTYEGPRGIVKIRHLNLHSRNEQEVTLNHQKIGFFGSVSSYRPLLLNLDHNNLLLETAGSTGRVQYVIRLNSEGASVDSIKREVIDVGYSTLLLGNFYLGLRGDPNNREEVYIAYPVIFDDTGKVVREYRETRIFSYHTPFSSQYANSLYLLSPDKRSVIFFDRDSGDHYLIGGTGSREIGIISVYRIVYGDEVGKSCIAVRPVVLKKEASLTSAMVKTVTSTERMLILSRSTMKAKVGDIESFWYQVSLGGIKGWVLGKDIDILAEPESVLYGAVNDTNVRLRERPNLQGKQLRLLNHGTPVEVIEETLEPMKVGTAEAIWYRVKLEDGTIGWMYGQYLDLR